MLAFEQFWALIFFWCNNLLSVVYKKACKKLDQNNIWYIFLLFFKHAVCNILGSSKTSLINGRRCDTVRHKWVHQVICFRSADHGEGSRAWWWTCYHRWKCKVDLVLCLWVLLTDLGQWLCILKWYWKQNILDNFAF